MFWDQQNLLVGRTLGWIRTAVGPVATRRDHPSQPGFAPALLAPGTWTILPVGKNGPFFQTISRLKWSISRLKWSIFPPKMDHFPRLKWIISPPKMDHFPGKMDHFQTISF